MHFTLHRKLFEKLLNALAHIRYDNGMDNTPAMLHMMGYIHSDEYRAAVAPLPAREKIKPSKMANMSLPLNIPK